MHTGIPQTTQRTRRIIQLLPIAATAILLSGGVGCSEDQSITTFRDNFVGGFSEGLKAIFGAVVDAGVATVLEDSSSSNSNATDTTSALNAP